MFDNALDAITKTGFNISKAVIEKPKFSSVTLCKVVSRLLLAMVKFERYFMLIDFRIDYRTIPQECLNPIDPNLFKKVGLILVIWTNSCQVMRRPLEIDLSEPGFDFFSRLGHGDKAERAIKKIVCDNRVNDSDRIVLCRKLNRLLSIIYGYFSFRR